MLRRGLVTGLLGWVLCGIWVQGRNAPQEAENRQGMRKFALLIGNKEYTKLSPLTNPIRDIEALEKVLTKLNFAVTVERDRKRGQMEEAIKIFGKRVSLKDLVFFYYSGHGIQVDNRNYLLPVDFNAKEPDKDGAKMDMEDRGLPADVVQKHLKNTGAKVRVMVLDACRDNPFGDKSGGSMGLAKMESAAGELIAYATGAGQTAADDPGKSLGLYMQHLQKALTQEGTVELREAFRQTREAVILAADAERKNQRPALYDDLTGKIYLTQVKHCTGDNFTKKIRTSSKLKEIKDFLQVCRIEKAHPIIIGEVEKELSAAEGRKNLKEAKEVWSFVNESSNVETLKSFVNEYKKVEAVAVLVDEARAQLGKLMVEQAVQGMTFVPIPAGQFEMGCVSNDGCYGKEGRPVHTVRVEKFELSKYEVTFEEYDRFTAATGRDRADDEGWGRGQRPVINVSWEDAVAYTEWMSEQTGERYRLPSEAEWEYAARAGTEKKYSWGNEIGSNRANCDECGSEWSGEQTAPVGSFDPNRWGLHNMHGNVWEWVQDCSNMDYDGAPQDGSAWGEWRL